MVSLIRLWEPMRDPVYNYIYYNEELEEKIIDTTYIQRLRQLYQLPTARFVYPGANHSRFLHSLGVMELAGKFATSLLQEVELDKEEKAILIESARVVGLLHDCGHGPFSHTFDEAVISEEKSLKKKGIRSHEDISRIIIEKSELKDILSSWGLDKIVRDIFIGSEHLHLLEKSISRIFRKWIFTADVLDFLVRDAYFCGIKEWGVDSERIIRWTIPYKGALASEKRLLPSISTFLLSRFHMFEYVYFHRTSRAIDCLVNEILQKASAPLGIIERVEKCAEGDFASFLELTDDSILNMILQHQSSEKEIQEARKLVKCVRTRDIPIRSVDEFSPIYKTTNGLILDTLERKYPKKEKLSKEVKKAFLLEVEKKRFDEPALIYVDYTDFRYLSDYPLSWTGSLPIYDRHTNEVRLKPVVNEFLSQYAVSPKKIRVYTDKKFDEKYGGSIRKHKVLQKVLAQTAETKMPVY